MDELATDLEAIEEMLCTVTDYIAKNPHRAAAMFSELERDWISTMNAQYDSRMMRGFDSFPLSTRQLRMLRKAQMKIVSAIATQIERGPG